MNKLSVGDTVPDFTMRSTDREAFNLYKELENGPILLNFYIGDFGINCTTYMTKLIESKDRLKKMGVRFVAINPDSLESHKMWRDRMGSDFEHIFDEKQAVSKEYGAIVEAESMVKGFTNREFFLIGKDRKIKFYWASEIPKMLPDVNELLDGVEKTL